MSETFWVYIAGILGAVIVLVAVVAGFHSGVRSGNEQRARSVVVCVEHGGVWIGNDGTCLTR